MKSSQVSSEVSSEVSSAVQLAGDSCPETTPQDEYFDYALRFDVLADFFRRVPKPVRYLCLTPLV